MTRPSWLARRGKAMKNDSPAVARFMRRQQVAFELGISRHTLNRMLKRDTTFPRFFELTPGIEVIAAVDFEHWLRKKHRASLIAPS